MSTAKARARLRAMSGPVAPALSAFADSSHMGASVRNRDVASWLPGYGSADADTLPDLPLLMSRTRDLNRNHGIASSIQQTHADNVIGTGLRLIPTPDYRALGKTKEWANEWSRIAASVWRSHADTVQIDAAGTSNFAGLCTLAFRGAMGNGDGLALPLWIPRQGSRFSTRIQMIESDRLSNPLGQPDTEKLRGGIEIDGYGYPQAYWIRKQHPGDIMLSWINPNLWDWERVPAETAWGRKRVLHLHDKDRTGQTRGKPILSPILTQFKMLDHYQRTELQAAIVNAMIAAFIQTPLDSASLVEMLGGDASSQAYKDFLANRGENVAPLKGGAIVPLQPGDTLAPFLPGRPNAAFGPFTENILRHIGTAVGLPYELLLKDFSKTNYSSARAALLEAWRFFNGRRKWIADYFATPIYELVLEEAINAGMIEAPDFYENRWAYCGCRWIGPGRGWVDPVKEATAAQLRIDGYVSTLERECAEQGLDWEEVLEQRAVEQARMEELRLVPSAVLSSRQPQQLEDVEDNPEETIPGQEKKAA